jgi:excinuclease ABC subunit B
MTKKMAEDLTDYLEKLNFKVRYLHSDIETLERSEILRDLRLGEFDILIGINLLREGLDLPEVALVAILDADKEGFLRSTRSIIQIAGRAARNVEGRIILYADVMTDSIKRAIDESQRRREKQLAYNQEHGITPQTISREIREHLSPYLAPDTAAKNATAEKRGKYSSGRKTLTEKVDKAEIPLLVELLTKEMATAAADLEFEKAAKIRDRIVELKDMIK